MTNPILTGKELLAMLGLAAGIAAGSAGLISMLPDDSDDTPATVVEYNADEGGWTVNGEPVPGDCGAEDSCEVRIMADGEYRAVPIPH